MRSLKWLAAFALFPSAAVAQLFPYFPPPGPGTPVEFVACPERTAGGSWVATDIASGYTYGLPDGSVRPNVYVRVSGVVSPYLKDTPGWALTPVQVVVGQAPCQSAGVLQRVVLPPPPGLRAPTPLIGLLPRY